MLLLRTRALLGRRGRNSAKRGAICAGFSLTEMVVTVAVIMVMAAIAVPVLSHAFANYQLGDSATRLSGVLKYTRYEAIRLNKPETVVVQASGTNWTVFGDLISNGTPDPSEPTDIVVAPVALMPSAGVPDTTPISSSFGSPTLVLTSLSGMNGAVTFDARGAVTSGGGSAVYAFYLGNAAEPQLGYRAVVLFPSGMVQIWNSASGTWQLAN
jgi:type II secretory pathway pseudopilin PulG